MKTKVIISGGFVPTKLQSKKQIEKAIKEVEHYHNKAKNMISFCSK